MKAYEYATHTDTHRYFGSSFTRTSDDVVDSSQFNKILFSLQLMSLNDVVDYSYDVVGTATTTHANTDYVHERPPKAT